MLACDIAHTEEKRKIEIHNAEEAGESRGRPDTTYLYCDWVIGKPYRQGAVGINCKLACITICRWTVAGIPLTIK